MLERSRSKRKNRNAVALGRLGGLKGGKRRAASLSATRRREIATAAARARWSAGADTRAPSEERNAARTRQRIAAAALAEFANHGTAGARVERIARRAGVNKRMIYHYYGSKDGLLRSVANGFYERLIAAGGSEETSLGDAFEATQQTMIENLPWMRVAAWESLRHDRRWTPPAGQRAFWSAAVEGIRAAQQAGQIRADMDAAQLQLSIVALVMFPFVLPHIAQMITGLRVTDPGFLETRAESLRAFAACVERSEKNHDR